MTRQRRGGGRTPLGSIALLLAAAAILTSDPALAGDPDPQSSSTLEPAPVTSPTPELSADPSPTPRPSPDQSLISEPSPEGSEGPTPSKTPTASPAPAAAGDERPTRGAAKSAKAAATDNQFKPMELTVAVGTRVVWTNIGQNLHTVTANDRVFDSGTLEGGQTFAVTFDEVGHFPYYCQIHGEPGSSGCSVW